MSSAPHSLASGTGPAIPALRRTATQAVPAPANDDAAPAAAVNMAPFRDVPRWVWKFYLSAWAMLFGLFVLFFAVNLAAAFAVTIAALFAVMAFGLPTVLAAQARDSGSEPLAIVHTHTGPLSAFAAGAQIVLIPAAAVIGLVAFLLLAA